jgi:hypothetical protein
MGAVEAFTTARCEGRNHMVANFEVLYFGPDFADMAGKFVTHDEVGAGFLVAAVDMEFTGDGG